MVQTTLEEAGVSSRTRSKDVGTTSKPPARTTQPKKDTKNKVKEETEGGDTKHPSKKAKVGKAGRSETTQTKEEEDVEEEGESTTTKPPSKRQRKSVGAAKPKSKGVPEDQDGVLERGHIYFFYRPKIDIGPDDTVQSIDDVARFDFLLLPRTQGKEKQRFRLFIIGKKRLPDRNKGGREVFCATLSKYGDDFEKMNMREAIGERNYTTKTRGDRHIEPARVAGRGHYALFSPKPGTPSRRTTHLVYFLTHPGSKEIGPIQKELSIYESGSFIIQIKNPKASTPANAGLRKDKRADYGDDILDDKFGGDADKGAGRRFIAPNPASMLDFIGSEMLMIPDKHSVDEIMEGAEGEQVEKAIERDVKMDEKKMSARSVLGELRLDEETFPCDALDGHWL